MTGTGENVTTKFYILCGDGNFSDWTWSVVKVTGGDASDERENVPSGASC